MSDRQNKSVQGPAGEPTNRDGRPLDSDRRVLALVMVGILLLVILAAFTYLAVFGECKVRTDALMTLVGVVFGPLVALVGSIVGFYFGAKSRGYEGH